MTGKEKAFIKAYVDDIKRNGAAAAIAAGYSEKSAKQTAYKLIHKPEIKEAIDEELKERHKQNTAKADEVIEFLTAVMRGEDVETLPIYIRKGVQEFKDGKPSTRDRTKAAELLGKHYGLFTETARDDNGEGSGVIVIPEVIDSS